MKWFAASNVTPADPNSLQEVVPQDGDYTDLETGDKCFVIVNENTRIYIYDETNAESEDFYLTIVIPTANVSGTGAWKEKRMTGIISFFQGTTANTFDALVTEDGGTVSLNFEASGSNPGLGIYNNEFVTIPIQSVELTVGTDEAPQTNHIYLLGSDPTVLVAGTTGHWPAEFHIKIAYCLVPSAAYVAANGCYINQNWNDGSRGGDLGHLAHITENIRLTQKGAIWHSGVDANGGTEGYITIDTGPTPDEISFQSTSGLAYEMHVHEIPAYNTDNGDNILVVNSSTAAYRAIQDISDEVEDSLGGSLNNKYYNIVFMGVANKTGEYAPLLMNMPGGSYNSALNAQRDVDGYDNYSLPLEFVNESSTGFLICRITFRNQGGNLSVENTTDLRGQTPGTASGSTVYAGTDFSDDLFTVFDADDISRIVDFDLAGITTGNTRTISPADADMTILSTTNHDDLTDGGDTTLHDHDGISENSAARHAESHSVASHNDTTATGAELEELTDGSDTTLHDHDGISENTAARHDESHSVASHNDTTATGAELNTLTDGSETALHYHNLLADNGQTGVTYTTGGAAELRYNNVKTMDTGVGLIKVHGPSLSDYIQLKHDDTFGSITNTNHGGGISFSGYTAGGAPKTMLYMDPDSTVDLYTAGALTASVYNGYIQIGTAAATNHARFASNSVYFGIIGQKAGQKLYLWGKNGIGTANQPMIEGDTDGSVDLYYAGVKNFWTTDEGAETRGGIKFPATQVASSDANTLDDYEEGTFTPVLADATTGGNTATGSFEGKYTKTGNKATVTITANNIDTTGMTAGVLLYFRNLPFASAPTYEFTAPPLTDNVVTGDAGVCVLMNANSSWCFLKKIRSGDTDQNCNVQDYTDGVADVNFTITYFTS